MLKLDKGNQTLSQTEMNIKPFLSEYLWQDDSFSGLGDHYNCGQHHFENPGSEIKHVRQIFDLYPCDFKKLDNSSQSPVTAQNEAQTTKILRNTVMNTPFPVSLHT